MLTKMLDFIWKHKNQWIEREAVLRAASPPACGPPPSGRRCWCGLVLCVILLLLFQTAPMNVSFRGSCAGTCEPPFISVLVQSVLAWHVHWGNTTPTHPALLMSTHSVTPPAVLLLWDGDISSACLHFFGGCTAVKPQWLLFRLRAGQFLLMRRCLNVLWCSLVNDDTFSFVNLELNVSRRSVEQTISIESLNCVQFLPKHPQTFWNIWMVS